MDAKKKYQLRDRAIRMLAKDGKFRAAILKKQHSCPHCPKTTRIA